jgi:hypothetical protein
MVHSYAVGRLERREKIPRPATELEHRATRRDVETHESLKGASIILSNHSAAQRRVHVGVHTGPLALNEAPVLRRISIAQAPVFLARAQRI